LNKTYAKDMHSKSKEEYSNKSDELDLISVIVAKENVPRISAEPVKAAFGWGHFL